MRPQRFLRYVALLVVVSLPSVLLGILAMEITLRMIPVTKLGFPAPNPIYRFHPRLLYDVTHDFSDSQVAAGAGIWRPIIDRPKRRFRILVLGDSYSAGADNRANWPTYVRNILDQAG